MSIRRTSKYVYARQAIVERRQTYVNVRKYALTVCQQTSKVQKRALTRFICVNCASMGIRRTSPCVLRVDRQQTIVKRMLQCQRASTCVHGQRPTKNRWSQTYTLMWVSTLSVHLSVDGRQTYDNLCRKVSDDFNLCRRGVRRSSDERQTSVRLGQTWSDDR